MTMNRMIAIAVPLLLGSFLVGCTAASPSFPAPQKQSDSTKTEPTPTPTPSTWREYTKSMNLKENRAEQKRWEIALERIGEYTIIVSESGDWLYLEQRDGFSIDLPEKVFGCSDETLSSLGLIRSDFSHYKNREAWALDFLSRVHPRTEPDDYNYRVVLCDSSDRLITIPELQK